MWQGILYIQMISCVNICTHMVQGESVRNMIYKYADLNDLSKYITDQIGFDRLRSARSISIYRLES